MSGCIWECAMPGWGRIRKGKECSLLCHSAHYLHPGSELNRDDSIDRMILRTICTLTRWLPKPPRDRWCLTLLRSRQPCPPRPWVTAGSGRTPNPAFPHPTTFLGDYSGIRDNPFTGGGVALWTDMRLDVCFGVRCGHGEDAFYGSF